MNVAIKKAKPDALGRINALKPYDVFVDGKHIGHAFYNGATNYRRRQWKATGLNGQPLGQGKDRKTLISNMVSTL